MSVRAALIAIRYHTQQTYRLRELSGTKMAIVRQFIFAHMTGHKCTKKESGITRLRTMLHDYFDCSGCEAAKEKQFAERAEAKLKELQEGATALRGQYAEESAIIDR